MFNIKINKNKDRSKKWEGGHCVKHRIIFLVFTFIMISGCQSNRIPDTIEQHGDFTNLKGLDHFTERVKNHKKTYINYVFFGIEGQRFVDELSYKGETIHVTRSLDKKTIEEYECKSIKKQSLVLDITYTLKDCTKPIGDRILTTFPRSKLD